MKKSFFIKRGISVAAAMVLLTATTVSASGDRIVRSVGQYKLNNPDGTTAVIDTDDIEANAQAIKLLQGQLGGLSFKNSSTADMISTYGADKVDATLSGNDTEDSKGYYWSYNESSKKWVKIGAVGTAIASDVLTGKKFSSESGVDIEGTMPNPTQAAVNAYTAPTTGTNVNAGSVESGNNVTITNSDGTSTASAATNIDLGIGQSVTIPRGYYNGNITIRNNVANRGSASTVLTTSSKTKTFAAGYYDAFTVSTDITNIPGTITYTYHHHSLSDPNYTTSSANGGSYADSYQSASPMGCFTKAVKIPGRCGGTVYTDGSGSTSHGFDVWTYCSRCGQTYSAFSREELAKMGYSTVEEYINSINSSGGCNKTVYSKTVYEKSCGKSEGQIVTATIVY